jgi:hypothetical protein
LQQPCFFPNRLVFGCFSVFLRLKKISRPHKKEPSVLLLSLVILGQAFFSTNQHQPKGLAATLFFCKPLSFWLFFGLFKTKKDFPTPQKETFCFY